MQPAVPPAETGVPCNSHRAEPNPVLGRLATRNLVFWKQSRTRGKTRLPGMIPTMPQQGSGSTRG